MDCAAHTHVLMELVGHLNQRYFSNHFHTGLWVYGDGGVGKSYTVIEHLESLNKPYVLCNSPCQGAACSTGSPPTQPA